MYLYIYCSKFSLGAQRHYFVPSIESKSLAAQWLPVVPHAHDGADCPYLPYDEHIFLLNLLAAASGFLGAFAAGFVDRRRLAGVPGGGKAGRDSADAGRNPARAGSAFG